MVNHNYSVALAETLPYLCHFSEKEQKSGEDKVEKTDPDLTWRGYQWRNRKYTQGMLCTHVWVLGTGWYLGGFVC